jgi:hypothetical protein
LTQQIQSPACLATKHAQHWRLHQQRNPQAKEKTTEDLPHNLAWDKTPLLVQRRLCLGLIAKSARLLQLLASMRLGWWRVLDLRVVSPAIGAGR